jgi:imidazolonepropionase-like amidohydrolase
VQARLKERVDYIKLMHESGTVMSLDLPKPSVALQRSIVEAAHAEGLKVVAHATCLADTLEILSCGVDGLTHTFVDQPPTPELIAAYKRNNAHCNPTLAAMASGTTEGQAIQERFAHDPRVQHLIAPGQRDAMCACMSFARGGSATVKNCFETVRQLKAADVPVIM